ncbi:alpha/beta fold hydrolase [Terasakiella pusilla]|uniref:alpha/beta fold hydrolase n=1 Tax=Terasakiella pusilla TaxID=64973 RepID=UPI003AA8F33D
MGRYQEKLITAGDGLKLYVRDYRPVAEGQGKRPVVCLSGLTRNSQDFEEIAETLSGLGHRVVCLDYRGRGRSQYDENWTNYHPRTYVSDIFNVCTALNLHGCTFIGTSLGGLLAMAMCVVAPGLVHSAILNDVGPDLNEEGVSKIIAYTEDDEAVPDLDGAVRKLKKHYKDEEGFVDKDWQAIAQKTYKLEQGSYVPSWDVKIAQNLKAESALEERKDLWPYFYALADRPVLVVRGGASQVFDKTTFDKMCVGLTSISGVEVPNVGHAPTLSEAVVEKAILDFMSNIS